MQGCSTEMHPIDRRAAEQFMRKFEHLGNVGLGVWHYGMFLDEVLSSVLSLGAPCFSGRRGDLAQLAQRQGIGIIQLCRGGTSSSAPRNTGSKAVSMMLGALEQQFGPTLVVAYADPRYGEVGTIYQACNAVHTGWTDPKGQANYVVHGRRMSGWMVRKTFGTRDRTLLRELDPAMRIEYLRPKLRYVMVAAGGVKRQHVLRELETLRKPYPKRDDLGIRSMLGREIVRLSDTGGDRVALKRSEDRPEMYDGSTPPNDSSSSDACRQNARRSASEGRV